ncbi:TolC family outer membrane protein [Roseateles albus]|uniref:TolC family outer membrane protein n=1 Tax=Roseateles albus TaxID=2987525 RepID=A0ABT5KDX5_9BURK|nr:TolC family outer membrane protein [Roseateles albus]MDC8772116.1 TolC family outer membrane protein [Roseateles albus]
MRGLKTAPLGMMAAALLALAGGASAQTLLDSYRSARVSDPRYKAVEFNTQAVGTLTDQAFAGFLPSAKFDLERTSTRQKIISSENPIFGAGMTTFPTTNQTLSITQPLFRVDVLRRFEQAKSSVKQAGYVLLAAEQDLMVRTAAAYLLVLAANDAVAFAKAEREAVARALELAQEKLKMGLGTITNLHDATARHALTVAREIEARNKLADAKQGLREITGQPTEQLQTLREDFALTLPEPAEVEPWLQISAEQNLSLQARREGVEIARQEIERQRAGHFPSVNMVVSQNLKDSGSTLYGGGSNVRTTEFGVRLTVPIFEGGLTTAVTKEAALRHQKSQEELEQERRAVERQARAAFDSTVSGTTLVKALGQAVLAQQGALGAKEQGQRSGLFTLLPVLDAQRDLYAAKRDHAQARYEYLLNRLKLAQAAGTLSEQHLSEVSEALQ